MKKGLINKKGNRAFTLVELLMVIVILGVLGAVALPKYFPQSEKSRLSEAISILGAIRQGEEAYKLENNGYLAVTGASTDWEKLGIANPNLDAKTFDFTVTVSGSGATAAFIATATKRDVFTYGGKYPPGKTIGIKETGYLCGGNDPHPLIPPSLCFGGSCVACS